MTPRFSILIPTWQNLAYLDLAYRSIRRYSRAAHEVIVFFNGRTPACDRWAAGKDVRCDGSAENLGVCGAVNRAARLATADHLCFLNDDMVVLPGWDEALARRLGVAEKLWLSGTAIEPGRAAAGYLGGCDYGSSPEHFDEARLLDEYQALRRPYDIVSTWTPILLARRDWLAVGGFDEAYFPGSGSELDLAMKMCAYGCRYFIGVGSCLVYHFSRRTIARFDHGRRRHMDPRRHFRKTWGLSRRRFLERVICRDRIITPHLLHTIESRAARLGR